MDWRRCPEKNGTPGQQKSFSKYCRKGHPGPSRNRGGVSFQPADEGASPGSGWDQAWSHGMRPIKGVLVQVTLLTASVPWALPQGHPYQETEEWGDVTSTKTK